MKKKIIIAVSILLLLVIVVCIALNDDKSKDMGEKDSSSAVSESAAEPAAEPHELIKKDYSINEFDSALIDYLHSNGYYNSNFVISPASFRASLCLAAKGAEGNTCTELITALGFTDMTELEQWYRAHQNSVYLSMSAMDKTAKSLGLDGAPLSVYASVWEDTAQLSGFTNLYKAFVDEQPFADAYASSADEISGKLDSYVIDKTEGAATSIERDVTGAASVLVSLTQMNALWADGFTQGEVTTGTFLNIDGTVSTQEFIEQTNDFLYAEKNGTEILVLPMEGEMSMVIFLGNRTDMYAGLSDLHRETVHVTLPRFKMSSVFDASDLLNFLMQRGVREALDSSTANFFGMCENADWFLQEVLQRSEISLSVFDPFAGDTQTSTNGTDDSDVKEFTVDSPFSFAVFSDLGDKEQQLMLYGQMMTSE